ncbi:Lrp/AsnC family transcriptional regulator [Enterococcus crotali]|uniref:Lrp/AsnC family transcriptional regulator n=1 Tax=Enterococcus crotali TaxID=1453587 RepID=UPI000471C5B9|nr:Lrp/AsnC family transcriptional regulator [Enterococcus crotali]OTP49846.1 hypothetical protein A5881_001261 [Enterococcus termitis]
MDSIDYQILELLEKNARISITELSQHISLSSPAVKERILKLEEKGIIEGYTTKINYKKLGKTVEAFILFETSNCKAFREFCSQQPDVLECHRLAGKYSYLVHITTSSMEMLEVFIDNSLRYGNSSTHIVFSSYIK